MSFISRFVGALFAAADHVAGLVDRGGLCNAGIFEVGCDEQEVGDVAGVDGEGVGCHTLVPCRIVLAIEVVEVGYCTGLILPC